MRRVATVGTFDGLHRGHQFLLEALANEAATRGMEPMVVCFDRHPLETIAPSKAPALIQSPTRRNSALESQGFCVETLRFTPDMAAMTARQWLHMMHSTHGVDRLLLGYDNTFGSDCSTMTHADYMAIGKEEGVDVTSVPCLPGATSSAIRALIREGRVEEGAEMLGRPFAVNGIVTQGSKIGRKIGFPTANITPSYRALLPKEGVYAVNVTLPDGSIRKGIANVGRRPTVGSELPLTLEVNIDNFVGDLYGQELTVEFLKRLRDEVKFPSLEALKEQIKMDKQHLNEIWK